MIFSPTVYYWANSYAENISSYLIQLNSKEKQANFGRKYTLSMKFDRVISHFFFNL